MKLNIIFSLLAVPAHCWVSNIVHGPLGCGNSFKITTFRGRTFAVPLDPECRVLGHELGRQRDPYAPSVAMMKWRQKLARFGMRYTNRRSHENYNRENYFG